ncbi:MAG TPA: hypothetical protein VK447_14435 [Myxococcaceae bacterium]|nr:hypothetical protein [Myxococcaceae bacterium]
MLESPVALGISTELGREPAAEPVRAQPRWIIGRGADVLFLMGGTGLGYALLLSYAALRFDLAPVWFAWMLLLNGPHLFATYARTYLAADERSARGPLFRWSLLLFLGGPAVLLLCGGLSLAGVASPRAPLIGFQLFVSLWAFWHIVRQHHGIVRLYQRRNEDEDPLDRRLDFLLIHAGLIAPFLAFLVQHPELHTILRIPPHAGGTLAVVQRFVTTAAAVILGGLVAWMVARQLQRFASGRRLNLPKLLFFAAVMPFYALVLFSDVMRSAPLFAISPLLVIPHDVQYHAMVRFYLRNRGRQVVAPGVAADLGTKLAASLPLYAACALGMGAVLAIMSCATDLALGCGWIPGGSTVSISGWISPRDLLMVTFQGFLMHHYFVDQFIWKPSREARVAERLNLRPAT